MNQESELSRWISAELDRRVSRAVKTEIDRLVVGDATGSPRGIMNTAGVRLHEQPWTVRRGVWAQW